MKVYVVISYCTEWNDDELKDEDNVYVDRVFKKRVDAEKYVEHQYEILEANCDDREYYEIIEKELM